MGVFPRCKLSSLFEQYFSAVPAATYYHCGRICVHQVVYGNSSAVDRTVSKLSTLAMLINYALKRLQKDMPNIYLALGFLFWVHDLLFTVKGVQKTKLIKILI